MDIEQHKIPQATAKRLPLYYRFINNLHSQGKQRVSSKELSEAVKVDSATIRRDFSYFGALGKKGYGYNVEYLLSFFRKTLDQDEITKVALIGVGNLGTAFLHYNFMKNNNTKIEYAFDTNADKIGTEIGGETIRFPVGELASLLRLRLPGSCLDPSPTGVSPFPRHPFRFYEKEPYVVRT
ncbi:redox-sensing transcriptional repressor [Thalassobacillus cyri]|uniref:Redox-sensing transcriptional repressor Rex n=1 Tax=Thalassobacillus cyri TaxID=571932 RepID=A0A1H4F7C6_9BACI|nr:redox-sensing transcriptional repressor [Thalassobacillus cyri]